MNQINFKTCALLLLMVFAIGAVFAQQSQITGTVKDVNGPLPGVTVTLVGTNRVAQTDGRGRFTITATSGDRLRFSSIGFISAELQVGSAPTIDIQLQADAGNIDEVVVTGLGEQRERRQLGYAMTQISGDQIRQTNAINPIAALQGMVPGLQVNVGTGGPQSSPRFLIRGAGSLDPFGNTPLIVVDGIIMDEEVVLPHRGGDQDFGNILKNINPDDIESISVLNGGSVTALYGSRASNGVIMITTKKGYSQRGFGIGLTHTQGFDQPYSTVNFQDIYGPGTNPNAEYVVGADGIEQIPTTNYAYSFGKKFDGRPIRDVDGRVVPFQVNNHPLDIYETGRYMNTNLSLQGGNERTTFRFSYSNAYAKGASPNNRLDRNNFNLRATQRLGNAIQLDGGVTYVNSAAFNPQYGGDRWNMNNNLLYRLSFGLPRQYDLLYWRDNYIDPINGGVNTDDASGRTSLLFNLYEQKQMNTEDNFRGNLNSRINFTEWLTLESNFSANLFATNRQIMNRGFEDRFEGGNYSNYSSRVLQTRYINSLRANRSFGDFDVMGQAGLELNHSSRNGINSRTDGMLIPDVFRLSNSRLRPITTEDKPNQQRSVSAIFQTAVDYKNGLTLNLYGRNDWDSSLVYPDGTGNYSYFYYGTDAAWVFSDMLGLTGDVLSFGKLRASYNQVGKGTNVYNAMTGFYTPRDPYTQGISVYNFDSKRLGNSNLRPERSSTWEVGTEMKMFNNRFGVNATYYSRDTRDQIIDLPVSRESGVTRALINSGHIRNYGIELGVHGTPVKVGDFSWDTFFNFTRNRDKILRLAPGVDIHELESDDGIRTIAKVGGSYGTMVSNYGHALFQARDASGNPVDHVNNGKNVMTLLGTNMGRFVRSQDYGQGLERETVIGSVLPSFMGSIINRFNYKSFSVSFMLDAKFGGYVYSPTYNYGMQTGQIASSLWGRPGMEGSVEFTNAAGNQAWGVVPDGVFAQGTRIGGQDVGGLTYQETTDRGLTVPISDVNYYNSSYGWGTGIRERSAFESSWIMVRDVSVSYDLPQTVASRLKLNNLRLTVNGRNLGFLYNSLPDNLNPEDLRSTSAAASMLGGGTPLMRNFNFTINTNF
ncbi:MULTISPECIES: SusC/RagA family TonB-linked outer membrane protein [Sphingobacterium]|uniref:SusC/RagA family TonB-linked outer membrane protein n=1 Tax=Sphingobacterium populi TaxID=1812824 RepID=A0ABW5U7U7_9SPHI|nr:SusC/RagA family TonB-linked outer membrane protein [Sphingobacterium sp. CFCC 11742]